MKWKFFASSIYELSRTLNDVRTLILTMTTICEAEITPVIKTSEMLKLAQLAEEVGIDRLGISDVIFSQDTFELKPLYALVTKLILIGSLVTNLITKHPP